MLRGKTAFKGYIFLCLSILFLSACNTQDDRSQPASKESTLNELMEVTSHATQQSEETIKENTSTTKHTVYTTDYFNSKNTLQKSNFSCEDKVFTVIEFNHYPAKLHQVIVEWKDPLGEVRERNDFKYFITGEQAFAWASLKLHRGAGAGLLQWINPAAGMEEFIGEWTVSVTVGDIIKETLNFEVLC